MGALPFTSMAFPRPLQRELESLAGEEDGELQAAGLRSLASRLETPHPELSTQIYEFLAESTATPVEDRAVARDRFEALQGRGKGGVRWEQLIGRFTHEATDYRMILPMLAAGTVAGLVKTAALGRLSATSAAWFSRGAGARIGANGLAFAAEVPVFSFSARGLRTLSGESSAASLSQELASTALTLGFLKTFSAFGARLAPSPSPSLQLAFTTLGLFSAHGVEERLGWRPASDGAGRAVDALAATLSLGIGARLGDKVLGRNFARFQKEAAWRGELANHLPRPFLGSEPAPWGLQPLMMSASESGSGKNPTELGELRSQEAREKGYVLNRELSSYRQIFGLTLLGDLQRNIETRLEGLDRPLRILELGAGDGVAASQLKGRFGEKIQLETNDRYPLPETAVSDRHHLGDFAETKLEGHYDLILSAYGPLAHHEGRFGPMLQKAVEHLAPGGELVAALTASSLHREKSQAWRKLGTFPQSKAALEQGLLLRLEEAPPSHLLYVRRVTDRGPVDWERILGATGPVKNSSEESAKVLSKTFRSSALRAEGQEWSLGESAALNLARTLSELGLDNLEKTGSNFPQRLLDRYVTAFRKNHHRPPQPNEIQNWLDGTEPSPIWRKEMLIDEWLSLAAAEIEATPSPSRLPSALLGLGVGLTTFLQEAPAWAGNGEAFSPRLDPIGVVTLVGSILLATWYGGSWIVWKCRSSKSTVDLSRRERKYLEAVRMQLYGDSYRDYEAHPAFATLHTLLLHYQTAITKGKSPFHEVGDRLILKTLKQNPELFQEMIPRFQRLINEIRSNHGLPKLRVESKPNFLLLKNETLPPALAFAQPENQQEPFRGDGAERFQQRFLERQRLEDEEARRLEKGGEERPVGWVKVERQNILRTLKKRHLQDWERDVAIQNQLTRLTQSIYRSDADIVDAAKLCWDLSVSPDSSPDGRKVFEGAYSAFVNSPYFFRKDSAPVYRESLRLRRIYSDRQTKLDHRLRAVNASVWLFDKFDFANPVARGEATMAQDSLGALLEEGVLVKGGRHYMAVNGARLDLDNAEYYRRKMVRWVRHMGEEDEQ